MPVCRYYIPGRCTAGARCRYAHPAKGPSRVEQNQAAVAGGADRQAAARRLLVPPPPAALDAAPPLKAAGGAGGGGGGAPAESGGGAQPAWGGAKPPWTSSAGSGSSPQQPLPHCSGYHGDHQAADSWEQRSGECGEREYTEEEWEDYYAQLGQNYEQQQWQEQGQYSGDVYEWYAGSSEGHQPAAAGQKPGAEAVLEAEFSGLSVRHQPSSGRWRGIQLDVCQVRGWHCCLGARVEQALCRRMSLHVCLSATWWRKWQTCRSRVQTAVRPRVVRPAASRILHSGHALVSAFFRPALGRAGVRESGAGTG